MTQNTRYFIQPGSNFTDFSLDFAPDVTLTGHAITVKGTSGADYLYLAGSFDVDFSESLTGEDVVFVRGMRSAFTPSLVNGNLLLSRGNTASLRMSEGDVVVFDDGKVTVSAWTNALRNATAAPSTDTSVNSLGTANEVALRTLGATPPTAVVRAFGGGAEGNTFAQVQAGMTLSVKGTSSIDVVYVKPGTIVDFSESLTGEDKLYLTGAFADYRGSTVNGNLRLTRLG